MNFLNTTTLVLCPFQCKAWTTISFCCLLHECPGTQKISGVGKLGPEEGQLEKLHCRAWFCVVDLCQKKAAKLACNKGFFCTFSAHYNAMPEDNTFVYSLWSSWTWAPQMCIARDKFYTVQHDSIRWDGSVFLCVCKYFQCSKRKGPILAGFFLWPSKILTGLALQFRRTIGTGGDWMEL